MSDNKLANKIKKIVNNSFMTSEQKLNDIDIAIKNYEWIIPREKELLIEFVGVLQKNKHLYSYDFYYIENLINFVIKQIEGEEFVFNQTIDTLIGKTNEKRI